MAGTRGHGNWVSSLTAIVVVVGARPSSSSPKEAPSRSDPRK